MEHALRFEILQWKKDETAVRTNPKSRVVFSKKYWHLFGTKSTVFWCILGTCYSEWEDRGGIQTRAVRLCETIGRLQGLYGQDRLAREFIYLNDGWPKYEISISHLQLMRNKFEFQTKGTRTITECNEYHIWA